jgi:hypothetical protein
MPGNAASQVLPASEVLPSTAVRGVLCLSRVLGQPGRRTVSRTWWTNWSAVRGSPRRAVAAGFGRSALRWKNKIFAMLVRGRLVAKLPAPRVEALVADSAGVHFDANKGTPMVEWFSLNPDSSLPWLPLAREALDYAQARR